jgi:hypothetical protein
MPKQTLRLRSKPWQHHARNGGEVHSSSHNRLRVKDLVIAESCRGRIRSSGGVDKRAGRVCQPAQTRHSSVGRLVAATGSGSATIAIQTSTRYSTAATPRGAVIQATLKTTPAAVATQTVASSTSPSGRGSTRSVAST